MYARSFNFDRFRGKSKGRRSSDSSVMEMVETNKNARRNSVANPMVVITEATEGTAGMARRGGERAAGSGTHGKTGHERIRAQSMTFIGSPMSRSRSRSVSKKQAKRLIIQETSQVINKKLNNFLSEYGLQKPIALKARSSGHITKTFQIYVANTRDCIYLAPASSASFTYEDVENGGVAHANEEDHATGSDPPPPAPNTRVSSIEQNEIENSSNKDASIDSFSSGNHTPPGLLEKIKNFNSPNYLCTKIDSDTPIPHTFAVIIELKKETTVKDVTFEFKSGVNLLWPSGDPYSKEHFKENFKIGYMQWQTSLGDCDFYLNTLNSNEIKCKNLTPEDLSKRTREYKLISVAELATGTDGVNNPQTSSFSPIRKKSVNHGDSDTTSFNENPNEVYGPGMYVFLLPILIPEHIPPTVLSINGSLNHILSVKFNKVSEKLSRKTKVSSSYTLPMVRTPPSSANCVADKPIYVSRVWNDSLHYIITFPKKYVPLGSEHLINVKLSPLVKNIIVKRIKFNILERITYVSRDLSKEYDYDSEDPHLLRPTYPENKTRERSISLCELKTKSKSSSSASTEPYKEEIIKCPDNNLLFSCYEPESDDLPLDDPLYKGEGQAMIASSLDVNVALPFLTTMQDKNFQTSSVDDELNVASTVTSRRASVYNKGSRSDSLSSTLSPSSNVIGSLETNLSHECIVSDTNDDDEIITPDSSAYMTDMEKHKANIQQGHTSVSRALYPDCNFRHIQIHHRLQVCFRISKPDAKDDYKMHHYEVVVDTPIVLLSSKCNDVSIQLPTYNEVETMSQTGDTAGIDAESFKFRIPNFNSDSLESNSQQAQKDTCLPSFEEAMSQPSSPITRSISLGDDSLTGLSRMSSIDIPSEPAPSYDVATNSSDDLISTFNIDAVVADESKVGAVKGKRSKLRDSLANSFAPTVKQASPDRAFATTSDSPEQVSSDCASNKSKANSISTVESSEDSLLEGKLGANSNSCDTDRSSSNDCAVGGSTSECSIVENNFKHISPVATIESALEYNPAPPTLNDSTGISEMNNEKSSIAANDDRASVVSEGTSANFDLHLPLLANCSDDNFNKSRTTLTTEANVGFGISKESLNNLNQHQLRSISPMNEF